MNITDLIKSDKTTLVNFFATWCGPCHTMKPQLDQTVEDMGESINFFRVDIDKDRELAEEFQIKSIPTTIIIKNGEIMWRQSGVYPASELIRLVKENL